MVTIFDQNKLMRYKPTWNRAEKWTQSDVMSNFKLVPRVVHLSHGGADLYRGHVIANVWKCKLEIENDAS